jgi:hypothetical protein
LHAGSETTAVKITAHLVPEQNEVQGQSSYDCRNTIILIEAVPNGNKPTKISLKSEVELINNATEIMMIF